MRLLTLSLSSTLLAACVDSGHIADQIEPVCPFSVEPPVFGIELPDIGGPPKPAPATRFLRLSAETASFMGYPFGTHGRVDLEVAEKLMKDAIAREEYGAERNQEIAVAADKNLAVHEVLDLLRVARRAGLRRAHLFGRPSQISPSPPPPNPALFAELRDTTPAMRGMRAAQVVDSAIILCPDFTRAFLAIGSVPPEMKCELFAAGARESGFPCWLDADSLVTAMLAMWTPELLTTAHTVTLDPELPSPMFDPATTWGQALPTLGETSTLGVALPVAPTASARPKARRRRRQGR